LSWTTEDVEEENHNDNDNGPEKEIFVERIQDFNSLCEFWYTRFKVT
jgi:hypothetical protein